MHVQVVDFQDEISAQLMCTGCQHAFFLPRRRLCDAFSTQLSTFLVDIVQAVMPFPARLIERRR
jgi:hypothetical protein